LESCYAQSFVSNHTTTLIRSPADRGPLLVNIYLFTFYVQSSVGPPAHKLFRSLFFWFFNGCFSAAACNSYRVVFGVTTDNSYATGDLEMVRSTIPILSLFRVEGTGV
jgi:hypothetical protein